MAGAMEPAPTTPPAPGREIAAALRNLLPDGPGSLPSGLGRPAGVLVPLIAGPEPPSLVFTERTAGLSRHAGQVSFPGGMPHPGDDDLYATARRVAREELGIEPDSTEPRAVDGPTP